MIKYYKSIIYRMSLFHYTTIETLFSIIKGINTEDENNIRFTLRATHAGFLNDLTEGQLLTKALRKIGTPECLLNSLISIQGYPFVVSLSELEDDLNMWRSYANIGKGVSIGLDKEIIKDTLDHQAWSNIAEFEKCEYFSEEEIEDYLRQCNIEEIIRDPNKLPLERLLSKALKYKNNAFAAEKEWRIYANYVESDFRVSNTDNLIIPYYKVLLPIEAIVSITFGPKCDYERNSFSTYRLIKTTIGERHAERIEYKKSNVPLV